MRTMDELLAEHPFFVGLDEDTVALLSGCATNVHWRPGEYLFHEGEAADRFYVVRHGAVALEVHRPGPGTVVIDTLGEGEMLGFSWLVDPFRYLFDARAVEQTSCVSLDGLCLRGKCDTDSRLGYELMKRVAHTMYERMLAAQVRLLDLYGASGVPVR